MIHSSPPLSPMLGDLPIKWAAFGRLAGGYIFANEVNDSWNLSFGVQYFEGVEAGCFKVKVHHEYSTPSVREFDGRVYERHRAPNATFKRIEGGDVHIVRRPIGNSVDLAEQCRIRAELEISLHKNSYRPALFARLTQGF